MGDIKTLKIVQKKRESILSKKGKKGKKGKKKEVEKEMNIIVEEEGN
jgi:hypothetical protein